MQSPPTRTLEGMAVGAALAAPLAVPLYLAVFTDTVFEPDKAALLRGLALVAGAAGIGAWAAGRSRPRDAAGWRRPVVAVALAMWLVEALATAASVAPWTSLFGDHARGQGLLAAAAATVLLLVVAAFFRAGDLAALGACVGAAVLPAGLYAVLQSFGLDPLPWQGDVAVRAAGPAGASVLFGAHLVMALPFAGWMAARAWAAAAAAPTAGRTLTLGAWLTTLAVGLWALALSNSRGPILGLAAGLMIGWLAGLARAGRRRAAHSAAAAAIALALGVVGLNAAVRAGGPGPVLILARAPVLDRLSHALDPEHSTTRVRLRVWLGATEALAALGPRAPIGYGPETLGLVYAPFYPPILAYDEPRGWVPDRAHNVLVDALLSGGIAGAVAVLALFGVLVAACFRQLGLVEARGHRTWLAWSGAGAIAGLAAGRLLGALLTPLLRGDALPPPHAAHAWVLAAPGLGLGGVAGLALWLAFGAVRTAGEGDAGTDRPSARPAETAAAPEALGFAAAALVAIVAHWVELQVGFTATSTRLILALAAGGLAAASRPPAGLAGVAARSAAVAGGNEALVGVGSMTVDRRRAEGHVVGAFAALVVGGTLVFDLARPGLLTGGGAVAAAMVVAAALGVGIAVGGSSSPSTPAAGRTDRPGRSDRVEGGAAPGLTSLAAAMLSVYALGHVALLRAGTHGPADSWRGVAASSTWYCGALVGLVVIWGRARAGAGSPRRPVVGGLAVAATAVCAVAFVPSVADALSKEGRLGWQAHVSALVAAGESGKAESFLDRARDRYTWAARLAPWEPAYRLADARASVEWGDLIAGRLARVETRAGSTRSPDRRAALAAERDARFDAAMRALEDAARLSGPAPGPALAHARAMRVWGERTAEGEGRSTRLAAARAAYSDAIRLAPRWPEVLDEAALAALLAGDVPAALALTERARALDPYFTRALRTEAQAHVQGGDPATAADLYARYFADHRNAGDLVARRAQVSALAAAGQTGEALPVARDVVRLAPGDAHAYADLAALLAATGDATAALEAARRAAALSPADPAIADLVRRLSTSAP